MGLWQNLVAGYDENPELSCVDKGGLYPLSSTTISNQSGFLVIIMLDKNGIPVGDDGKPCWEIVPERNDRRGVALRTFPIPVTQESLSRARESHPHPLFDQREYVFPVFEGGKQKATKKNNQYKELLREFAESDYATEAVKAVWRYISNENRLYENDLPDKIKAKTPILFRVEIPGQANSDLWTNPETFSAWHAFYSQRVASKSSRALDFVTGEIIPTAQFHPKKIVTFAGNAKLVSANDKSNFTFRGIYRHPDDLVPLQRQEQFKSSFGLTDAVTIGYEASQKAHQFLRHLIDSHGIRCGEQVIVPFNIRSKGKSQPMPPIEDTDLDWDDEESKTVADERSTLRSRTGCEYAESIRKALAGYELDNQWKAHARSAIVILESATPGRLSITFYREFASSDYMEHIQAWHETCKWPLRRKNGNDTEPYLGAPSIEKIIHAVYGWPKPGQDKSYETIRKRARQNLLRTIFDNAPVPPDYLANAVRRVSNPSGITDANGKFNKDFFFSALATTCAILRHHYTNTKESFDMNIDLARTDRDYLYGRLLGAADKLEEYALRKKDNSRLDTAAIRYMQTFSMRPFTTWTTIHDSLLPYKQQVKGCFADQELQAIENKFASVESYADDSPLSGLYLIGYYHEREYIASLITDAKAKQQLQNSSDTTNQPQEN